MTVRLSAVLPSRRVLLTTALGMVTGTALRRPLRAVAGSPPVTLRIPAIDVDAPVEIRTTIDGTMQDPTDPWIAAWYDDSAFPGTGSNAVFAGHVDDPDGSEAALFARLDELRDGDLLVVADAAGAVWHYRVVWARTYAAAGSPLWVELAGPTAGDVDTLITCAGMWDAAAGTYRDRLVVRGARVTIVAPDPGDVPPHPRG